MSRGADSETLYPETLVIAPGASLKIMAIAGQISVLLKNNISAAGSLCITNIVDSLGSSAAISQQYPLGIGEILTFDSTGAFYLSSFGATSTCFMIRLRTAQTGN